MGHPGPWALNQLLKKADGVSFKGRGPRIGECNACAMSKLKQQINRSSVRTLPVKEKFEEINID